jgi:hypothetical protein
MKTYKTIRIVIGLITISIAIFQLKYYMLYKNIRDNKEPIKYEYIDKIIHKGRGAYYQIKISYEQTEAIVDITSKNYYEIDKNKFPLIFYSKENQTFFLNG